MWVIWHQKGKLTILDFTEAQDERVTMASAGLYPQLATCTPAPHANVKALKAMLSTRILKSNTN